MHADPHPGNILLGRDGQLQFLDFGLITHMDKKHQDAMLALIVHLVNGDWQGLTDDLVDMDVVKPTTDRFAVRLVCHRLPNSLALSLQFLLREVCEVLLYIPSDCLDAINPSSNLRTWVSCPSEV